MLQNLHTHTKFCDGQDSPEEIVLEAIAKGFDTIGLSAHSFTPFDTSYCLKDEKGYISECRRLKERYKDRIEVLCGIEQDFFSPPPDYEYDYIIGSVHYIKVGGEYGEYIPIDESADILINAAKRHFGGDMTALCREYFRTVSDVAEKTGCRIIGHFDLITKFMEISPGLINPDSPEYILAETEALAKLASADRIFEVNTGAMARGYRTQPYPSQRILKKIHELGGRVILTSDCHKKERLDYGFEQANRLIGSCGFKEQYFYKDGKFTAEALLG